MVFEYHYMNMSPPLINPATCHEKLCLLTTSTYISEFTELYISYRSPSLSQSLYTYLEYKITSFDIKIFQN